MSVVPPTSSVESNLLVAGLVVAPAEVTAVAAGLKALADLSDKTEDDRKRIIAGGGIVFIMSSMQAWPNSYAVQQWACAALGRLCKGPNSRHQDQIMETGVFACILEAMHNHIIVADIQQWGCFALGSLAFNRSANQTVLGAAGAAQAVVQAMQVSFVLRVKSSPGLPYA
jgi:hypothetical protein